MSTALISVVMATFGRGPHLRPSIDSVLRQTYPNFELIVVGDGDPSSATVVAEYASPRVRWEALATTSGSQAAPNNLGIGAARGDWIAYLGHDDVWSARHLELIAAAIAAAPAPELVVSGCFYHGPPGTGVLGVTGFIADAQDATRHFLPPSSVAHARAMWHRIGPWRDPRTVAPPDDAEFMLRAADAGCRFAATGRVSVHKFAAGHRYLSYLAPGSAEQAAMLAHPRLDDPAAWAGEIEQARTRGRFMAMRHPDYAELAPGALFARNRSSKGLARPALRPLGAGASMQQTAVAQGIDWMLPEPGAPRWRWTGINPRPKILIPFTHGGPAAVTLHMLGGALPLHDVHVVDRAGRVETTVSAGPDEATIAFETMLHPDDHSVLELRLPPPAPGAIAAGGRAGLALGEIDLVAR